MLLDFILPADGRIPGISPNAKPGTEPIQPYNPYNQLVNPFSLAGYPGSFPMGSITPFVPGTGSWGAVTSLLPLPLGKS